MSIERRPRVLALLRSGARPTCNARNRLVASAAVIARLRISTVIYDLKAALGLTTPGPGRARHRPHASSCRCSQPHARRLTSASGTILIGWEQLTEPPEDAIALADECGQMIRRSVSPR